MDAHVATAAEGDLQRGFVAAGPAVVHDQALQRETDLTAAVARQHDVPETAEEEVRAAVPVITAAAPAAREHGTTAASPAAPGGLSHTRSSLPCGRTWIRWSGTPASSAAPSSSSQSQAELTDSGTPTQSRFRRAGDRPRRRDRPIRGDGARAAR